MERSDMYTNKVRVTLMHGGSGFVGWINPKVGMQTNFGPILILDSGNFQVTVGVGSGSYQQKFYPHQLEITQAHATGLHAWPTGDGGLKFGHAGIFPNGVTQGLGTGVAYAKADGTIATFGR
jgi:hypothetical protein